MPIYWAANYNVRTGRGNDWINWLKSEEAKNHFKRIEEEIGWKYVGDFTISYGGGPFDFEQWFELPNYAALDKVRDSKAWDEFYKAVFPLVDVQGAKTKLYRSLTEVRRYEPLG